jgi:hypothetical protein
VKSGTLVQRQLIIADDLDLIILRITTHLFFGRSNSPSSLGKVAFEPTSHPSSQKISGVIQVRGAIDHQLYLIERADQRKFPIHGLTPILIVCRPF